LGHVQLAGDCLSRNVWLNADHHQNSGARSSGSELIFYGHSDAVGNGNGERAEQVL
jgi:hypothetical protein